MRVILSLLSIPVVRHVILLKLVVGIPAGVFHSMFTVVNMERFAITPETNGRLLSYFGILTMVCDVMGSSRCRLSVGEVM